MCAKHWKAIGSPPKAITSDYTWQSVKLGVNQAYCSAHSQKGQNRWEKFNPWCPLSCSYHIMLHRTRSLSLFLSFFPSFFLSVLSFPSLSLSFLFLSLSLTLSFCGKWQISFEECDMFEGLFSDNRSDHLAITICCIPSPGQALEPFP